MVVDSPISLSPLHEVHVRSGARMVSFAGWNMPVQYTGISDEHQTVRTSAGIFDISHMGQFWARGPAALDWLNGLLTNDVSKLNVGQGQYTLLLNDKGGVIDDLIIYRTGPEEWLLVVNASMISVDYQWMRERVVPDVELINESAFFAGMAIQGPLAADVFGKVLASHARLPDRNGAAIFASSSKGGKCVICRTGYTGEDGFEFFCPAGEAAKWWDLFIAAGAKACGLGARDTLRLEMGYPLNGNDLSPDRTPLEAGLGFFVDLNKGAFVGRTVLAGQKTDGLPSKLVGLRLIDKGPPPRAHYQVYQGDRLLGELCSGGVGVSLEGVGIGMAYLPPDAAMVGTKVEIDVRGRRFAAEVVKKPFYRRPS